MKRLFTLVFCLLFFFLPAVISPAGGEGSAIWDDWHYCESESGASFSVMLSPDKPLNDTLFFQTSGQRVCIMLGNQLIYEYECQGRKLLTSYGRSWHMVKLPKLTQPELLQVEIQGGYGFERGYLSEFSLDTAKVQAGKVFLYDLPYVLSLPARKMQEHANKLEYEIAVAVEKSEWDTLTGCRNRVAFDQFMQQRYQEKFSMLMLDIDFFKEVNDKLGHDIGDKVLRKFSLLVQQANGLPAALGLRSGRGPVTSQANCSGVWIPRYIRPKIMAVIGYVLWQEKVK
ncbi:MAG: GGDEF domain-containing protein [Selenomonadaceae bacterium]|nr:GGDEF domain-containing protein [Selenomonadaceae bacterium]